MAKRKRGGKAAAAAKVPAANNKQPNGSEPDQAGPASKGDANDLAGGSPSKLSNSAGDWKDLIDAFADIRSQQQATSKSPPAALLQQLCNDETLPLRIWPAFSQSPQEVPAEVLLLLVMLFNNSSHLKRSTFLELVTADALSALFDRLIDNFMQNKRLGDGTMVHIFQFFQSCFARLDVPAVRGCCLDLVLFHLWELVTPDHPAAHPRSSASVPPQWAAPLPPPHAS